VGPGRWSATGTLELAAHSGDLTREARNRALVLGLGHGLVLCGGGEEAKPSKLLARWTVAASRNFVE
jgi:hypothetical protein